MIEQTKYEKLFSTPLIRFRVPNHAVLNAALLFEGERLREKDEGVSKSNRGGWHSKGNLFDSDAESIRAPVLTRIGASSRWNFRETVG